jgi:peptidoglycan/LPS O-acetylase OafA/YrhL
LGLLFGGLLVTALNAAPGSALHRVASAPTLRFFGKYSYCMYVCHQPLILVLAPLGLNVGHLSRVLGNMVVAVVVMNGVALLLTVLVSLISWNLFEKHFLKLKDRFPVGPAPAPLTQPAA